MVGVGRLDVFPPVKGLSLLNTFWTHQQVPQRHDRLNSIVIDEDAYSGAPDQDYGCVAVPYCPKDSPIQTTCQFPILMDVKKQDVLEWCNRFSSLCKVNVWSDEQSIGAFNTLVDLTLQPIFGKTSKLASKIEILKKEKYPMSSRYYYDNFLRNWTQDSCFYIQDYYNILNATIKRLQICCSWTVTQSDMKLEECFFSGLSLHTRVELTKASINTSIDALSYLNNVESTLIPFTGKETRPNKHLFTSKSKESSNKAIIKSDHKGTKTCDIHGLGYHSNKECRVQLKSKTLIQKDSGGIKLIREPNHTFQLINLPIKVYDEDTFALIDTGAENNYISQEVVSSLELPVTDMQSTNIQFGDKNIVTCDKCTTLNFSFNGIADRKFTVTLGILPTLSAPLILGSTFCSEFGCIISYATSTITIDGYQIDLRTDKQKEWDKNPDSKLFSKSGVYSIKSNSFIENNLLKNFRLSNPETGKIDFLTHSIELNSSTPIVCKSYPVSVCVKEKVVIALQKLQDKGIIRSSLSQYSAPAFPVLKKNGEIRLIVNYQKLNSVTVKDESPFTSVDEQLSGLHGANFFSQLDLNSGYYQITVDEEDVPKTAFTILGKKWEFLRMPFGLSNAPRTFFKAMDYLLGSLDFVKVFLDDILIFSVTQEDHYNHVEKVLQILRDNHVSINFGKCNFFKTEIQYIGNIISKEGIRPIVNDNNLKKLFTIPKTRKQLMKLVGSINWFRPYVQNLSVKLAVITDKLKEKVFSWKESDSDTIRQITEEVINKPLLTHIDSSLPFTLETDASNTGFGAVLRQEQGIVKLYSQKFSLVEKRYSVMEKECYAIIKSLEHFRHIIIFSKVTIRTDNLNILFSNKLASNRVERWKLLIEEYNYEVNHIKGISNKLADTLSRINVLMEHERQFKYDFRSIAEGQYEIPKEIQNNAKEIVIQDIKLLTDNRDRLLIPKSYSSELLKKLHTFLIHPGESRFYYTIKNYLNIQNIRSNIKKIVQECINCQTKKDTNMKYGRTKGFLKSSIPCSIISSDIVGPIKLEPFPNNTGKNQFYIVSIIDICTRWTKLVGVTKVDAKTISTVLERKWIKRFGAPNKILTDQGTAYCSNVFNNMLKRYNIKHSLTSPYNPSCNGIAERINTTIHTVLRMKKNQQLSKAIHAAQDAINRGFNRNIQCCPEEAMFGSSNVDPLQRCFYKTTNQIAEETEKNSNIEQRKKNSTRKQVTLQRGDEIYSRKTQNSKLDDPWEGPFQVLKTDESGNRVQIQRGLKQTWLSIKNTKPVFKREGRMSYPI